MPKDKPKYYGPKPKTYALIDHVDLHIYHNLYKHWLLSDCPISRIPPVCIVCDKVIEGHLYNLSINNSIWISHFICSTRCFNFFVLKETL